MKRGQKREGPSFVCVALRRQKLNEFAMDWAPCRRRTGTRMVRVGGALMAVEIPLCVAHQLVFERQGYTVTILHPNGEQEKPAKAPGNLGLTIVRP